MHGDPATDNYLVLTDIDLDRLVSQVNDLMLGDTNWQPHCGIVVLPGGVFAQAMIDAG